MDVVPIVNENDTVSVSVSYFASPSYPCFISSNDNIYRKSNLATMTHYQPLLPQWFMQIISSY